MYVPPLTAENIELLALSKGLSKSELIQKAYESIDRNEPITDIVNILIQEKKDIPDNVYLVHIKNKLSSKKLENSTIEKIIELYEKNKKNK